MPDGNGLFNAFISVVFNDDGQLAFTAGLKGTSGGTTDDTGIYLHDGASLSNMVRENSAAPDGNGLYSSFGDPVLAANGYLAFFAGLKGTSGGANDNSGIYRRIPSLILIVDNIARENDPAPDGNGLFNGEFSPVVNGVGQVAFQASLRNTTGVTTDDIGIYLTGPSGLMTIARGNTAPPDGNGLLDKLSSPDINRSGQVVFGASLRNTALNASGLDNRGIYLYDGAQLLKRARANDPVPEGNGRFSSFSQAQLNNAGQIAFEASLTDTGAGNDDSGIYLHDGAKLVNLAREGQAPPDGNGLYGGFISGVSLNWSGIVEYSAGLIHTAGGSSDSGGLYLADSLQQVKVVRTGDILAGKVVNSFDSQLGSGGQDGKLTSLNDFGQVAYTAGFTDGTHGIFLFTPTLHWRSKSSGNWDDAINWTLGLNPARVHDVIIDPAGSLTINGPISDVNIRALTIGGGSGLATLALHAGATITPANPVLIQPTGILTGDGTINASVSNFGTILADNLTITGAFSNVGIVTGTGRINAVLNNAIDGDVRVESGQHLIFTRAGNVSVGKIEVTGGELEFQNDLTNQPGGRINCSDATLRFFSGLTNEGALNLSFGRHSINGRITNESGGRINVSGNSETTFWDDLTNNAGATVDITTGSTAVFFGNVINNGTFSGGGTKFFEGGSTGVMGSLVTTGSTVVEAGASITANRIREQSLTVNGSARLVPGTATNGASKVSSLSVTGTLDMTDNKMIVAGGDLGTWNGSAYTGITGLVQTGRNGG